jgi:hypothetical protein
LFYVFVLLHWLAMPEVNHVQRNLMWIIWALVEGLISATNGLQVSRNVVPSAMQTRDVTFGRMFLVPGCVG